MKKILLTAIVVCTALSLYAGRIDIKSYAGENPIPRKLLARGIHYDGFSIDKPYAGHWSVDYKQNTPLFALWFYEPLPELRHSFFATAYWIKGPNRMSDEIFLKFIDDMLSTAAGRFTVNERAVELTQFKGRKAVRFRAGAEDIEPQGSDEPLFMNITGYAIYVPYEGSYRILFAACVERGLKKELDGTLEPFGEEFLQNITIDLP